MCSNFEYKLYITYHVEDIIPPVYPEAIYNTLNQVLLPANVSGTESLLFSTAEEKKKKKEEEEQLSYAKFNKENRLA